MPLFKWLNLLDCSDLNATKCAKCDYSMLMHSCMYQTKQCFQIFDLPCLLTSCLEQLF